MRIATHRLGALAALLLLAAAPALAQSVTTSALRGTVTDPSGQPLPGANILAVHMPTGTEYGTATDLDGRFAFRNMRVGGPYVVSASYISYETQLQTGLMLALGETSEIRFQLAEEDVELDAVEVVADGGVFDRDQTGVNTNLSEEVIAALPTLGRDLSDFTRLTPQAYVENDDDDGPSISVAGQNNRFNTIYIDGAVNNDVFGLSAQGTNGGQTGSTPISIDAIEAFQIAISPFDVTQSGFTGGAINAVTRSGTNQFAGSVYGLFRNDGFAGKTPGILLAPDQEAQPLDDFSNNRFGFRLGGPIIKNKLFFFTNVELLRSETPQPFDQVYEGDTDEAGLTALRNTVRDELGYDPGNFGSKASTLDDDKVLVKLDWNINNAHRLSARYNYSAADNKDAFQSRNRAINFENNSEIFPNRTHSFASELNSTFGTDFANKAIVGFTRVEDDRGFDGGPFPAVTIDDGNGEIFLGSEPFSTANILNQSIFTFTDNFNWFLGDHVLTFGTNVEYYDIENLFIAQNFGDYEYDSTADFLQSVCAAGDGSSAYCQANYNGEGPAEPGRFVRGYSLVDGIAGDESGAIGRFSAIQVGFYAQDEWNPIEKLRLTLGLRVDVPKILDDPIFFADALDTTIPAIEAKYDIGGARPGQTPAAQLYLSPRLGFNYDALGDRTLQIRGGLGVFTGRVPFVWPGGMFTNNGATVGFAFGTELANGNPIPLATDPNAYLDNADLGNDDSGPSGRLEMFEEDFRYPQVFRTALGFDYQLPAGLVGTVEGQYTKTISNVNVNNVNLNPDAVIMTDGAGSRPIYDPTRDDVELDDRYSAIHVVSSTSKGYTYDITARLSQTLNDFISDGDRLDWNLAYTFGDAFAVNDGTSSQINSMWRATEFGDYLPNNEELTRSDFSIGHRVLASMTFRKEFIDHLATSISVVYTGESGRPFNYTVEDSEDLVGAPGARSFGLFYVPRDASEIVFEGDAAEQAAQWEALNTFIESSDYLTSRRGQFTERNGSRLPFEHIVDLRISQEIFGNLMGRRQKLEATLDIFNFTNLLNKDWGARYAKYASSSTGGFEMVEFQGFRDAANGDLTPVYVLEDINRAATEEEFFENQATDTGTYSSRWQMQLGVRYTF